MKPSTPHPKIWPEHLRRQAVVYIRQSSVHQVRDNRESTARQYALLERAQALGWPAKSVQTIDEDQGRSGAGAAHRQGFKKLLAEIGAGQVGVVLALEASRLARSSADWHRLVEICVVTQTLLADETAVYDPRDPNDRLLLGVKGTISEAEMFTLQSRLQAGRRNKALRGELARSLPAGYVRTEAGATVRDPDRQVQARIDYVFRLFRQLKVARQVVQQLVREKLKLPVTISGGPRHGQVRWRQADTRYVLRLLHNPTYAGAYVYGQTTRDPFTRSPQTGRTRVRKRPRAEWAVCIRDVYPAYITWEEYLRNQELLRANGYRPTSPGAPRQGRALLQGIVCCGRCGARMRVLHFSRTDKRPPWYCCDEAYRHQGQAACQYVSAREVDEAVTRLFLSAVSPAKIDIALQALEGLEADREEARRQWALQRQRADYEVELAQRRYEAADPSNRLVAAELETRWEAALREREQCQRDQEEFERSHVTPLAAVDRERIKALATDLEGVWHAATTSMAERKALLQFLVRRVHVDGKAEAGMIRVDVEWHTGAHSVVTVARPPAGTWAVQTPQAAVERLRELLGAHDYGTIAAKLNEEGFQTAKGCAYNAAIVGALVRARGWGRKQVEQGTRAEGKS